MPGKNVVTRTTRTARGREKFNFSKDMIPSIGGNGRYSDFIKDYQREAWEAFQNLDIPTTSEEAWRRTNLKTLKAGSFQLPDQVRTTAPAPPIELLEPLAGVKHGGQILLSPSGIQTELSSDLVNAGVIFTDLESAQYDHVGLVGKVIGEIVEVDESIFAAMTAAMSSMGVFVYVPPGVQVEKPLHSLLWGPGLNLAYFSHVIVYVDDGASLTYLHEAASPTEAKGQTLHSGIVEIHVGTGANLRFVELQSWGEHVWNFSHERAQVEKDGRIDWIFGAVGSRLTKNFSNLDLVGEGASGRMSGFYFTNGVQHLDHDTQQNHFAPNTTSDLLYKGALKDTSRSVWQGMIYVAPGAQKTDGYQANRNLVLSNKARADSIPGLEILADDVRCTHGATVGKIDADQVFYSLSRGIPYKESERLIVEGFFDPIIQRIPFDGVRARFQKAIATKMG
jgi:Fe-S cluster assembly protein SufD